MIQFLGITCLVELILILVAVAAFFIYRSMIKAKIESKDKKIIELKEKIVEYNDFAKTLISNLELIKYYEIVDKNTRLKIEAIQENINAYIPIVNEFVSWLNARKAEEANIVKKGNN